MSKDETKGTADRDKDEDEAPAASARPAHDDGRAERARRRRELEHGTTPTAAAGADDEDPTWWMPHAVLGVLVLMGVLGFFGVFNKVLGFLAAPRGASTGGEAAAAAAPTTKPASAPMPPNPMGSAAQAPREMFGAKHVLVMYKGGRRAPANVERSKEDAKKRAEEVLKKAKAGTKFEDLVKEYSDEPNAAQRGGDLGQFPKGAMVPEFQAGLEKTKVNEISEIVESPFGFHIILRTK